MDFQFAFWQMVYLFISPQKVFRDFAYRKRNKRHLLVYFIKLFALKFLFYIIETKNQFARDDPAFVVLLSLVLVGMSLSIMIILKHSWKLMIYVYS